MKYNFDKVIDRASSKAYKWENIQDNTISLTVADMDFEVAPEIREDMISHITNHGVFGYDKLGEDYYESIISWYKNRYKTTVEREWILYATGVIPALSSIVKALTKKGDKVLIQPPVYPNFYGVIDKIGRVAVENELLYSEGSYAIDFEDLESKLAQDDINVMIFCSPHNPIGKVWSKEDIEKIIELCNKHNVTLISDEIHSDLIFDNIKFTSLLDYVDNINNLIVCQAPTKTFNLAGIKAANIIVKNNELREKIEKRVEEDENNFNNTFSSIATISAYTKCEPWLNELMSYLENNRNFIHSYLGEKLPKVTLTKVEGTYLQWLDLSEYVNDSDDFVKFLEENYKVRLQSGVAYGSGGQGFVRLNFACPKKVLKETLERLVLGVKEFHN